MEEQTAKPTLWQRIKTGFKTAISYIPRGIVLTAVLFAGSAALNGAGWDLLGVVEAGKVEGALLGKFLTHLALGSVISGVIGATMPPCECANMGENIAPNANVMAKREEQEKGVAQQITEGLASAATQTLKHAATEAIAPGAGPAVSAAAQAATATAKAFSR